MSDQAITVSNLGKMYKLFNNRRDRILYSFGLLPQNRYNEFWALRNINLEINKGERIGIIGNNGAGKSTLLKTIIGNILPTEGYINVDGKIQALIELGTGFHPEFTGRENIKAALTYQGVPQKQIKGLQDEIIEFSELDEFIDRPFRTYSAGMQARLSFSVATAITPDILVVDEILGAGDAYFAGKSVERMRSITSDAGATVLFVSHDLSAVMQLCTRIIWIDRGCVLMDGDPLVVTKEYLKKVREREELRLRKRENESTTQGVKTLFRLIASNPNAKQTGKVYNINLLFGGIKEADIHVGAPMDNDENSDNNIIVRKGFTCWGHPKADSHGTYREIISNTGEYKHAPFQLNINPNHGEENYVIEIDAELDDELELQIYHNKHKKYSFVNKLMPAGIKKYIINISSITSLYITEDKNDTINENVIRYSYGNRMMTIENVSLLNEIGIDTRIFDEHGKLTVAIEYSTNGCIDKPVFVVCIYYPDGKCASQWFADNVDLGKNVFNGSGKVVYKINDLLLGKGNYIVSVGIFTKKPEIEEEADSYHVIDKSIYFEIKKPFGDTLERGLCLQPYEVYSSE